MERITALMEFFQQGDQASFLRFWQALPLQNQVFWHSLWDTLWTRSSAMSFLSYTFWVFLAICAVLYYFVPRPVKPAWLLACSYAFYLYDRNGLRLVAVLLGATAVTYLAGLLIELCKNVWARRFFLWVSVLSCGGLLLFYKYAGFFAELWSGFLGLFGVQFSGSVSLPAILGLSYFTFQSLGYVIDVYQGVVPAERNPVYYALYVSFFPCIVSGPIERANHLLPQLRKPARFNYTRISGGLFRMLWGVFKKLVVAGNLDLFTRQVFQNMADYHGGILALAALVFSYQLYMDFSGYCDIALGAGRVLGFELLENFDRPFAGRSYTQLWDRWHISLTTWFRDYIFTPLSFFNRGLSGALGKLQGWFNVFIIFPISGLWHGANMGYVVWGVLNGLFMVVGKATAKKRRKLAKRNPLYRLAFLKALIQCGCVYLLFTVCIVFFAASYYGGTVADGWYLFAHLPATATTATLGELLLDQLGFDAASLAVLAGSAAFVELLEFFGKPNVVIRKLWFPVRWVIYYALIAVILLFANFGASGFVYGTY